ncbi:MAG: hypothetical protein JG764_984 [Clostridiales bacterium]|nr:hypothetical protein [Clostridiales bacterium]
MSLKGSLTTIRVARLMLEELGKSKNITAEDMNKITEIQRLVKVVEGELEDKAIENGEVLDSKKMYEWCSHCQKKVVVENKFETQNCPECGEALKPCSICLLCLADSSCRLEYSY